MKTAPIYRLEQLRLDYGSSENHLLSIAAKRLGLKERDIANLQIARRSLDVRHRPVWVYGVDLMLDERHINNSNSKYLRKLPEPWQPPHQSAHSRHYIIVGAGPAGLSAAHILSQSGHKVTLLEQGKMVGERSKDVAALFQKGQLDEHSNLCAGEGGAGTFSDGKIYTRRADQRVDWFLKQMALLLDEPHLAIDYHAHVGTDKLVKLLTNWRSVLMNFGVEFHFETTVSRLIMSGKDVLGVECANGDKYMADGVILALGNSARQLWTALYQQGICLEVMPAALGVRVEHSQDAINSWRYGQWASLPDLPAAEYFYTAPFENRPCHTFCMCPGGTVIPTPTENGALAVNGMSNGKRGGAFANAAWICEYSSSDLTDNGHGPLSIVRFQEELERKIYQAGGGDYAAPAQRLDDFLSNRASVSLPRSSYRRPLVAQNMKELLPSWCSDALSFALNKLVKEAPFLRDGLLIGLESRPSNPLRITRDVNYQALGFNGLYPCGEGSGYASGITSSALDGILVAESLCNRT